MSIETIATTAMLTYSVSLALALLLLHLAATNRANKRVLISIAVGLIGVFIVATVTIFVTFPQLNRFSTAQMLFGGFLLVGAPMALLSMKASEIRPKGPNSKILQVILFIGMGLFIASLVTLNIITMSER